MTRVCTLTCAIALLLGGCGGDDDPDPPITAEPGLMVGQSLSGAALTVKVISAVPDPPIRSDVNAWQLELTDGDGEPVAGCAVAVDPTMPAHGHGTTPTPTITEVEGAVGVYEARPLNLFMPGEWAIEVQIDCAGLEDEVVFLVEIES